MIADYAGVLVLLACAVALCVALLLVPRFAARRASESEEPPLCKPDEPEVAATQREISGRHYPIAILFLVFGVGVLLVYPLCASFREVGWSGLGAMVVFVLPLGVGLAYGWSKGALEW